MYNIVTVTFKDSNTATANGVRQWDYGQILRIQGLQLPTAVEVHFALIDSKDSVTRIGITKDGVTDVVIPDSMIEAGKNIFAYVYLRDSESGQTEYEIKIVVTTRAKPEAFDTPEDKELFAQAIEAVNEAADRAEKAGQAATEAAGQAAEDAQQTAEDRKEVEKMVETVSDISEQVKKVEQLSQQAQDAATKAGKSEQAADGFKTQAESAKKDAEAAAVKTAEDKTAVENAKTEVLEVKTEVNADRTVVEQIKNEVEQLGGSIAGAVQSGVQEITQAGTAQKTAVEGAGTQAVESVDNVKASATEAVETAKTEAVQSVQTEGTKQTGSVTAEGTKQVKAVQDKGAEVLQSIPGDFQTAMASKLDKQQGIENKGKALVIGEDGNVVPGEVASGGGDGIAIVNTTSGESPLVIPDSAERVNKGFGLTGKTEQVTTTGKNLANPSEFVIGALAGDTGNIIGLKQYIATGYIPVIPGKRYSTSCGNKFLVHAIFAYDKEKTKINTVINMSSEMPEGAAYIRLSYKKIDMTNVTESDMEELKKVCMANEGSTVLPYEPYTGGKPSPSPEYPQKIKNAGKWNEETQKYEVEISISGKNIFNPSTCEEGKIFEGSGNIVSTTNGVLTDFIPCFPNSQYSRSRTGSTVVAFYDCDKNKIGFEIVGNTTFVTPEKCRYFRFSAVKTQVDYTKIVACPGQTVMDYEPYREPKFFTLTSDRPLTKWDRLVEQGGQIGWLYKSKIDALPKTGYRYIETGYFSKGNVFTDSALNSTVTPGSQFFTCFSLANPSSKKGDIAWLYVNKPGTTDLRVRFADESINTIELFEKYMADKDIKILYETAQTEFVPLPQSEQNAIRALKTYYPTTVITVDGGEVDPDIKVTYTADTKNYIDNKVSAKVASIIRQYRLNTANLLSLMPMETQAAMIENDTNNILENAEEMKHE